MANGHFGGGDGTKENPFLVEDALDVDAVRNNLTAFYKQTQDIDLSVIDNFIPIGTEESGAFRGGYDGDNKKIKNLRIKYIKGDPLYGEENSGFFGVIYNAHLKNIQLENADVEGDDYLGSLVGLVSLLYYDGSFRDLVQTPDGRVLAAIIENCHLLSGTVTSGEETSGKKSNGWIVGGLIGTIFISGYLEIKNCSVKGEIIGGLVRGGLIGIMHGGEGSIAKVSNCFAQMSYSDYAEDSVPGIGAFLGGTDSDNATIEIKHCYYTADKNQAIIPGQDIGVFLLMNEGASIITKSNYYDSDLIGVIDDPHAQPKTTAQLKQKDTFVDWDFITTWNIEENETYPFLDLRQARIKCQSFDFTD